MTEEQQKKIDADVLAALGTLGKTSNDGGWIPEYRFYNALKQYRHREVDEAVTRLADKIEIGYRRYDKIEYYYRLAPAGGNKD